MRRSILAAILIAFFAGCAADDTEMDGDDMGGSSGDGDQSEAEPIGAAQDFCDRMAAAVCDKLMTCLTAQERVERGVADDMATCLEEQGSCTPEDVCEPGLAYDPDHAGSCVIEYQAMSCDQFRRSDAEPGPECSAVCQ